MKIIGDGIIRCMYCCSETAQLSAVLTNKKQAAYVCAECAGKTFSAAEKRRATNRLAYFRNVDKSRLRLRAALYKTNASVIVEMNERQGGACAICGDVPRRGLNMDHCHTTGRIRGLLCASCNHVIGRVKDSPARLRNTALYLESVNA